MNTKLQADTVGSERFRPDLVRDAIAVECERVKAMLLEKNQAYGNSALEPLRVASRASAREQLLVRIDDKLSRLARGNGSADSEDVWLDLVGYVVLLRVHDRLAAPAVAAE